jgi:ABC-type dipeptide/oligopeptide/nickel transport system permease component
LILRATPVVYMRRSVPRRPIMLAHYLRRILGGVLTLLLASFSFYHAFVYMPVPPLPEYIVHPPRPLLGVLVYYIKHYELEHSWPVNYTNWLFDATEPDKPYSMLAWNGKIVEYTPPYVDAQVGPVHLRGSGLLTGDLGLSQLIQRDVPAIDVIGHDSVQLSLALLICANILLMAASVVQRRGRKPVLGAASAPLAAVAWVEATYRYARAAT